MFAVNTGKERTMGFTSDEEIKARKEALVTGLQAANPIRTGEASFTVTNPSKEARNVLKVLAGSYGAEIQETDNKLVVESRAVIKRLSELGLNIEGFAKE